MATTQHLDYSSQLAAKRMPPRMPGAVENTFVVSVSVVFTVGLSYLALILITPDAVKSWRLAATIATLGAALPFLLLGWKKANVLRTQVERELWEHYGVIVDLNQNGMTGSEEMESDNEPLDDAPAAPKAREVIRVVPYHANVQDDPVLKLPDGRELDARKVRDFVIGAGVVGLGINAWKSKGWTRQEWEIARDLLALHGLATERADGQAGKLLASAGQCMRAFGL